MTQEAFTAATVEFGKTLRELPLEAPKYIVDGAQGVKYPVPDGWADPGTIDEHTLFLLPALFMTDTYDPERQREANIPYIFPEEADAVKQPSIVISVN